MAAPLDIPIRRNEDWSRGFYLLDADGVPLDITGWTIELHVRSRTDNVTLVASGEIEMTDAGNGEFTVALRAGGGAALGSYGSSLQTENLPYDLRATDQLGTKLVLTAGVVILSRGVTHD